MSKKRKKPKRSTWGDVFYNAIIGGIHDLFVDHTYGFQDTESQHNRNIPHWKDTEMDEWGKRKTSGLRGLLSMIAALIFAYILNILSVDTPEAHRAVTVIYILIGIWIAVSAFFFIRGLIYRRND